MRADCRRHDVQIVAGLQAEVADQCPAPQAEAVPVRDRHIPAPTGSRPPPAGYHGSVVLIEQDRPTRIPDDASDRESAPLKGADPTGQ